MEKTLFNIVDICHSHKMETTFIQELHANGLIEMIILESEAYIDESQLPRLEKYANLYYDLQLNMEGLEIVENLLNRIRDLQQEIQTLRGLDSRYM